MIISRLKLSTAAILVTFSLQGVSGVVVTNTVNTASTVISQTQQSAGNVSSVFSGEGIMGDMYYLSPRYSQTVSTNSLLSEQTSAYSSTQVNESIKNIYSSIAKNKFGIENLNMEISSDYQANISSFQTQFQSLPSIDNISFGSLSAQQSTQLQESVLSSYNSLQEGYNTFQDISDSIGDGSILKLGLEGLADIEQKVTQILQGFESSGVISSVSDVLGEDTTQSMAQIMEFSGNFSQNSTDAQKMSSQNSSSSLGSGTCTCCPTKPKDLISKVDDKAKPLLTKESQLIEQANQVLNAMAQEVNNNKLGETSRSGYLGKIKVMSAAEYYMDQKKITALLNKINKLNISYEQSKISTDKNGINLIEMELSETISK